MAVDTSRTLSISQSPWRMFGLLLLGIAFTGLCGVLPFLFDDWFSRILVGAVGIVGFLFFGFCTLVIGWRLVTETGTVVTIAPEGVRDTRVAAEMVPWSAVTELYTWEYQGQRVMVIALDPQVERRLTLTRIARWSRGANTALGADGLAISAAGLTMPYDEMFASAQAYRAAGAATRPS